jgi:hypothetical protein
MCIEHSLTLVWMSSLTFSPYFSIVLLNRTSQSYFSMYFSINLTCRGPIIDFKIAFDHLIILTRTQCHVYNLENLKSPLVFEAVGLFSLLSLNSGNFAASGRDGILVYSYSGRKMSSVHYEGLDQYTVVDDLVSLSRDVLALVDQSDSKVIKNICIYCHKFSHCN